MNINLHEISIREVTQGYVDNDEEGVLGYGGGLRRERGAVGAEIGGMAYGRDDGGAVLGGVLGDGGDGVE